MEKCIGCELCAGVCPAKCIYVRGADNDPDDPTSPGERFGFVYEINYLRCIHCDLCVEACPTEAITESEAVRVQLHQPHGRDLHQGRAASSTTTASRKQLPWEDWREGEDVLTSGWMRATSPSGDADFVGEVGWSGELGYGVRKPEPSRRRRRSRTCIGRLRRVADGALRLRLRVGDGDRRRGRRRRAQPSRCTPRSAWSSRCSASPCCSSPRRRTSSPRCRSSSTPARSSCCSCS